jgi:chemotaxis protein MotA
MDFNPSRPMSNFSEEMDLSTLGGIFVAFALVFGAILLGGGVTLFFDLPSFLIIVGGTAGATLVTYPLEDVKNSIAVLRTAFFPDKHSALNRVNKILDISKRYRTDGALSVQDFAFRENDPFLRKCIELIADGIDPDEGIRILQTELTYIADRHRRGAQIFQTMGSVSPAMGLIGTLIGLVQMLQHLQDPSQIGPAMATALLTTFYGSLFAYLIFIPVAGKLKSRSAEETLIKQLTIDGTYCILRALNPRIIEQHLFSYLPPDQRSSQFS